MDTAHKEELKKYCNGFSNPVAIMDNKFRCAYSNKPKLIPQESSMMAVFQKTVVLPLDKVHITLAMIKGNFYGVRIAPLDAELYICEFFDQDMVLALAENTDIYHKILPIINGVEYNTAALWRGYNVLRSSLESEQYEDGRRCALEFEKYLTSMNSVIKNVSEYANMLFYTPKTNSVVDLALIMTGVVERCNTILTASGRYIDFICESEVIYINAEVRHVMCAVVNALQNALMYSPRDCIPYVTLYKPPNNDSYVVLQILNDNLMYVDRDSEEELGKNFDHQRLGYGIPIIKRFAELVGGSFEFGESEGKVRTAITLPLVRDPAVEKGIGALKSSQYVYYKTEIPDIVELKMLEVNELFGA